MKLLPLSINSAVRETQTNNSCDYPSMTVPGLAIDLRSIIRKINSGDPVPILRSLEYSNDASIDDPDTSDILYPNMVTSDDIKRIFPHLFPKKDDNEENLSE